MRFAGAWLDRSHDHLNGSSLGGKGGLQPRRSRRQSHSGIEMDGGGDRLTAENVQSMPSSQLCDHRAQFAQTDQPDLLGQLKDGGQGPFTPVGWKGFERPGERVGAIDDTQYGLA